MKVKFHSVLVGVEDIMKVKSFYEKVLNVDFVELRPPFSRFTMDGIDFHIEEDSPERSIGWVEKYRGTVKPVSFEVDDVDTFLKLVVENGGKIVANPVTKSWGWIDAEFSDPEGNIFMVEQEL